MARGAYTIISKNYLAQARALMASLSAHAPDVRRFVVLVDRIDGRFRPEQEDFELVLSEELAIPHSRWFHFKYTIMELNTAVKPYAAQHIMEKYGIDRLLYFDPDILLYNDPSRLYDALGSASILLTPHLTQPLEDDRRPSDLDILRSGTYNLGFIGMARGERSSRFLKWWQQKLYDHCVVDLPSGLFVDQRWVDLAPALFEGVRIERDAGCNVAYWNLAHREVRRTGAGYEVNGRPLIFFHFSGFDPDKPHGFSKHQNRFTLDDIGDCRFLAEDYQARLKEQGYAETKHWPYAYASFSNGCPIPDIGRMAHQESPGMVARVEDPFSKAGYEAFLDVWNGALSGGDGKPSGVTRLAYRIYRTRSDVQAVMPDIFNGDLKRFLEWLTSSGQREHHLADAFMSPVWDALEKLSAQPEEAARVAAMPPAVNEAIVKLLGENGQETDGRPIPADSMNRMTERGGAQLQLTYLAKAIYESRVDLQRYFPDPCGKDGLGYLVWFLTYGADEYRLAEQFLAPMRMQWEAVVEALERPHQRLWYRTVHAGTALTLSARKRLLALVRSVRARRRSARAAGEAKSRPAPVAAGNARPAGINFVGYVQSEMGIGESVRCAVRAARAASLAVAVRSVDAAGPYRLGDDSVKEVSADSPYRVNVVHVNADESPRVLAELGPQVSDGRYKIGYWAWELEEFPECWTGSFGLYDEIWTPSSFCQTAISRRSPVPVIRMPHAIEVDRIARVDRGSLSLSERQFVFLSVFDLLSVLERKNPIGLLRAFRAAFEGDRDRHLILKINHASERPEEMARIAEAADGLPVTIIDRTIDRAEVNGLMEMADCLVSLHRSEGFGMSIAEAMYLGKPVVATGYSGNVDFTLPDNSFLVSYRLGPVPPGCGPYGEGLRWAEPDTASAAAQMRRVANDEGERRARAERGQEFVRTRLSPAEVGRLMKERLGAIGQA